MGGDPGDALLWSTGGGGETLFDGEFDIGLDDDFGAFFDDEFGTVMRDDARRLLDRSGASFTVNRTRLFLLGVFGFDARRKIDFFGC